MSKPWDDDNKASGALASSSCTQGKHRECPDCACSCHYRKNRGHYQMLCDACSSDVDTLDVHALIYSDKDEWLCLDCYLEIECGIKMGEMK